MLGILFVYIRNPTESNIYNKIVSHSCNEIDFKRIYQIQELLIIIDFKKKNENMRWIVCICFTLTVFVSCQDDYKTTELIFSDILEPRITVISSVIAKVVDSNKNPVQNAEVVFGNYISETNENGLVFFKEQQFDRLGNVMQVNKTGFFPGLRRVNLHAGSESYIEFQLLDDEPDFNFDSKQASRIEDNSGVILEFTENSIATLNGQAYDGNVNLALHYIDPTSDDIINTLPGSLEGTTTQNERARLKSYAMIAAKLTSDQGEELNITEGSVVNISFPIPHNLVDNAPMEIQLWYLNEESGIWVEDGTASLIGNNYVGEVSHFSFWNCDVPNEAIVIEGSVCNRLSGDCHPLSFSEIIIYDSNDEISLFTRTDSKGNFTFLAPIGSEFTIDFFRDCSTNDDQISISSANEDINLGLVEISASLTEVQIDLELIGCSGETLRRGLVLINDKFYASVTDRKLSKTILVCDQNDISFTAFNSDFSRMSEEVILPFDESISTSLQVCDEAIDNGYIYVIIKNKNSDEEFSTRIVNLYFNECSERNAYTSFQGVLLNESEIRMSDAGVSFSHRGLCEAIDVENIKMSAYATFYGGNRDHVFLVNSHKEGPAGFDNVNILSEITINSFGLTKGDIIEGTAKGDISFSEILNYVTDEIEMINEEYTIELGFKFTILD